MIADVKGLGAVASGVSGRVTIATAHDGEVFVREMIPIEPTTHRRTR